MITKPKSGVGPLVPITIAILLPQIALWLYLLHEAVRVRGFHGWQTSHRNRVELELMALLIFACPAMGSFYGALLANRRARGAALGAFLGALGGLAVIVGIFIYQLTHLDWEF